MSGSTGKPRKHIPNQLRRELLLECGYRCSVPRCDVQWPTLQFHHIDDDPSNNSSRNLLVLCPTHHQWATSGHIDRKHCETVKESILAFATVPSIDRSASRNRLLYTLAHELFVNLHILGDAKLKSNTPEFVVYPRLLHLVSDTALTSGAFIQEQDAKLFKLLFGWTEACRDFNRRLELTENQLVFTGSANAIHEWKEKLTSGATIASTKEKLLEITDYLLDNYAEQSGVHRDTILFDEAKQS